MKYEVWTTRGRLHFEADWFTENEGYLRLFTKPARCEPSQMIPYKPGEPAKLWLGNCIFMASPGNWISIREIKEEPIIRAALYPNAVEEYKGGVK